MKNHSVNAHCSEVQNHVSLMSVLDKVAITFRTSSLSAHRQGVTHPSVDRDVGVDFVVRGKINVSAINGTKVGSS
jgi:hypothetical protein